MTIKNFEELDIWQMARDLSKAIYQASKTHDFQGDMRFRSQIRSAVGSIMDNIAEGFEREGKREFIQFLYIAKGSCGEVRSQLYRALDADYISDTQCSLLVNQTKSLGVKIANLINYLKQTEISGKKYQE